MTGAGFAGARLAGALDTLALADVLQLLDLGRKSGVLAVDAGDGVRQGLVRLRDGGVCAARYRDADGCEQRDLVDAVAAMLSLGVGRFTFAPDPPDAPPAAGSPGLRVEAVLLDAMRRLDEGAARATADGDGPPADDPMGRVPTLAVSDDPAHAAPVALRAADWALLAAIDGRRTVAEVAAAAGQPPARVVEALERLVADGLVQVDAGRAASGGRVAPPFVA